MMRWIRGVFNDEEFHRRQRGRGLQMKSDETLIHATKAYVCLGRNWSIGHNYTDKYLFS